MEQLEQIMDYGISFGRFEVTVAKVLVVFGIFIATKLFLNLLFRYLVRRFRRKGQEDKGRLFSLKQLIRYFVWVISLVIMMESVDLSVNVFLAGSAALLVGVGLGLQDTFRDVLSGVILLFEGTIKVGDIVEAKGLIGTVQQIGLRTSVVLTPDRIEVIVPNSQFVNEHVINWSRNDMLTRFSVSVGVAYGSDTTKVHQVLLAVANDHPDVVSEPAAYVEFKNFGDSSLDFTLWFFTRNILPLWKIRSELRFEIDQRFRAENITIPFPQRDVHIKQPTS